MFEQFGEDLQAAASRGDFEGVVSLLQRQTPTSILFEDDLEELQEELNDALSKAAREGHSTIVSLFLDHGAQIQPYTLACAARAGPNIQPVFEALRKHGWNVNDGATAPSPFSPRRSGGNYTPVLGLVVEHEHVVRWLLENGADPSLPCDPEESPLSAATLRSTITVVELLLANGANIQHSNALHYAVGSKNPIEMLQFLLDHGARINALKNETDPEAASMAPSRYGTGTALHEAASSGKTEVLQFLLECGADPNIKDREGETAIEIAEGFGHLDCAKMLNEWK